jgi:hypothetical protein
MAPILDALLPFGALKRAAIEKLEADDSGVNCAERRRNRPDRITHNE